MPLLEFYEQTLDKYYSDNSKYGRDKPNDGDSNSPYIVRNIGQTWGPNVENPSIRGGAAVASFRSAVDVLRHLKFLGDGSKGINFIAKQHGLQLTNPLVEKPVGSTYKIQPTRLYNEITFTGQPAVVAFGGHLNRHGDYTGVGNYISVVTTNNLESLWRKNNRLVKLTDALILGENPVLKNGIIPMLSGIGGPNSFYGIGSTNITKVWEGNTSYTNEPKNIGDITRYETIAYGKLGKNKDVSGPKDFLELKEFNLRKDGKNISSEVKYSTHNIYKTYGFPDSGNPNVDRSDFTKPTGLTDKINMIDVNINSSKEDNTNPYKDYKDFVKFVFYNAVDGGYPIVFRSFIDQFSDTFSPSWNSFNYNGRPDATYTYSNTDRTINLAFNVAAFSREEMRVIYRKLNYLAGLTYPTYKNGRMIGPWMRFTLGDYFQKTPCFITSLNFDPNLEAGWEINLENDKDMFQLPKFIKVNLGLQIIMDFRPTTTSRYFSIKKYKGYEGSFNNEGTAVEGDWLPESSNF